MSARALAAPLVRILAASAIAGTLAVPSAVAAAARHGRDLVGPAATGGLRAFAIGDSVMLDAQPYLARDGIAVDAAVSRQFFQGLDILRGLRATGRLPRRVVVGLGTNGPITSALFDAMMGVLRGKRRVVFVTVREPRWWEGEVNSVLRAGVARWRPTARLADWYALSWDEPGWFGDDGIHLTPAGAAAYAQLIAAAIR